MSPPAGDRVQARPRALRRLAETTHDADGDVLAAWAEARDALERLDAVSDPELVPAGIDGTLDAVRRLLDDRGTVAAEVAALAGALERLDGGPVARAQPGALLSALEDAAALPALLSSRTAAHDPLRWASLLAGGAPRCVATGAGHYAGGGLVRGPDGAWYPLVIPTVARDGGLHTGAGARLTWPQLNGLDGTDDAWATVAHQQGLTRLQPEAGLGSVLAAAAVATNARLMPDSVPVDAATLRSVRFGERGTMIAAPARAPAAVPAPPAGPPAAPARPPAAPSGATSRLARIGRRLRPSRLAGRGGLGLVAVAADAHRLAGATGAQGLATVDVAFQRGPDGRRRALARAVTGRRLADGTVRLVPGHLRVDRQGALSTVPMRAARGATIGPRTGGVRIAPAAPGGGDRR